METTWSFKLLALNSIGWRTASESFSICFDISLEFQPRFPGRLGESFNAAVVLIPAPIKNDFGDPRGNGALGDDFADKLGGGDIASTLCLLARFLVNRACGDQRLPSAVVNHL